MIVVEGPDGAGKTTLIHTIVEQTGLPVAPRVVSKEAKALMDLKVWVEDNVDQGFQAKIFDRHRLISEPIYGSVLRDRFEPGFDDVGWLMKMNLHFYMGCRPILIYCLPDYVTVAGNVFGDPDNEAVWSDIRKIYAQYVNKAATDQVQYFHNTFIYDYTSSGANDTLKLILERINHATEQL